MLLALNKYIIIHPLLPPHYTQLRMVIADPIDSNFMLFTSNAFEAGFSGFVWQTNRVFTGTRFLTYVWNTVFSTARSKRPFLTLAAKPRNKVPILCTFLIRVILSNALVKAHITDTRVMSVLLPTKPSPTLAPISRLQLRVRYTDHVPSTAFTHTRLSPGTVASEPAIAVLLPFVPSPTFTSVPGFFVCYLLANLSFTFAAPLADSRSDTMRVIFLVLPLVAPHTAALVATGQVSRLFVFDAYLIASRAFPITSMGHADILRVLHPSLVTHARPLLLVTSTVNSTVHVRFVAHFRALGVQTAPLDWVELWTLY